MRKFIDFVEQLDFFLQVNVIDRSLNGIEIMRFSALLADRHGHGRRAVLRDVMCRARRQLQIFYGNIVGVSVAGLRIGEHAHADAIGDRLGAVFDHPFFQTDALVLPILEIKIGIVRFFRQSGVENFFQIAVLYAEIVAKKCRRQICCCHMVSSKKVLPHKRRRIKLFLAHPNAVQAHRSALKSIDRPPLLG